MSLCTQDELEKNLHITQEELARNRELVSLLEEKAQSESVVERVEPSNQELVVQLQLDNARLEEAVTTLKSSVASLRETNTRYCLLSLRVFCRLYI